MLPGASKVFVSVTSGKVKEAAEWNLVEVYFQLD